MKICIKCKESIALTGRALCSVCAEILKVECKAAGFIFFSPDETRRFIEENIISKIIKVDLERISPLVSIERLRNYNFLCNCLNYIWVYKEKFPELIFLNFNNDWAINAKASNLWKAVFLAQTFIYKKPVFKCWQSVSAVKYFSYADEYYLMGTGWLIEQPITCRTHTEYTVIRKSRAENARR